MELTNRKKPPECKLFLGMFWGLMLELPFFLLLFYILW